MDDLDLLQQVMCELDWEEAEGAWETATYLAVADQWPHSALTSQTGAVTGRDAQREHIEAARRDIASARSLFDSAAEHLDGIEACMMMEGSHNFWATEGW